MIAIKGFEMPKGGKDCYFSKSYFAAYYYPRYYCPVAKKKCNQDSRPTWCPLVEIKEVEK